MFLVGFCVLAAVLHLLVPSPLDLHADMRSEKLLLLDEWHGKATAAAFGSSHVNNSFDPRVFDATLAGTPDAETSINLAVSGGAQTEQRRLALRFVHQLTPAAGETPLVLLELSAGANLTNDHLVHPRAINLYDEGTLRFAWGLGRGLGHGHLSRNQSLGRRGYALAAWGLYAANMGMISSRIFSAPMDAERVEQENEDDRRGLEVTPQSAKQRDEVLKTVSTMQWKQGTQAGTLVAANRLLAEELQATSAVPGLQVAYIVPPKLEDVAGVTTWPACINTGKGAVPILNVALPSLYPELYRDRANWLDEAHVSEKGAAIVTKALAAAWLQWKQHPSTACEG